MVDPAPTPRRVVLGDWLRVRPLWPVPGLIALVLCLPFVSDAAWQPSAGARGHVSLVNGACALAAAGALGYWAVLLLDRLGLLRGVHRLAMREPSEAELGVAAGLLRFLLLALVYVAPVVLLRRGC